MDDGLHPLHPARLGRPMKALAALIEYSPDLWERADQKLCQALEEEGGTCS